jgi:GNAT superfamily N-acetyltransferase
VSELERIEAAAMRDVLVLSGGRAETVGGALCLAHPLVAGAELNRALPLGPTVDLTAVHAWYGPTSHVVSVPPGSESLVARLRSLGYAEGYAWMKFSRDDGAAIPGPRTDLHISDLRISPTEDAAPFAAVAAGCGIPAGPAAALAQIVAAPGWLCFVAWAGVEPAGVGALYVDGPGAWLGVAFTLPAFRGRGAQTAILAARIDAARAAGATLLVTETGERLPDRPAASYRNILRAGFREEYRRSNWTSPA